MTDKPELKPCPYCGGSQQPFVPSSNLEEFGDRLETLVVKMNIAPEHAFAEAIGRFQSIVFEYYAIEGALKYDDAFDDAHAALLRRAKPFLLAEKRPPCAS